MDLTYLGRCFLVIVVMKAWPKVSHFPPYKWFNRWGHFHWGCQLNFDHFVVCFELDSAKKCVIFLKKKILIYFRVILRLLVHVGRFGRLRQARISGRSFSTNQSSVESAAKRALPQKGNYENKDLLF